MDISNFLGEVLKISFIEFCMIFGFLLGLGFLMGIIEKKAVFYCQQSFGRIGVLFTALIGTPIHELGHLIMCILFRHKVNEVKLLNITKNSSNLGYVGHSYNSKSTYQRIGNFFIGLGPIFSGTGSIILAMWILMPNSFGIFKESVTTSLAFEGINYDYMFNVYFHFKQLLISIFNTSNVYHIGFWIFLFLILSIASHIALSSADMEGVYEGGITIFIFILIINIIAGLMTIETMSGILILSKINLYIVNFLVLSLMFSVINYIIFLIIFKIKTTVSN